MASPASSSVIFFFAVAALMSLLAMPALAANQLNADQSLGTGNSLAQGPYQLSMQKDCNLVLYDSNNAVWATGTNGRASDCKLKMQSDGNLVIYSADKVIWASNTNRNRKADSYHLLLQRDRNVVIYDSSNNAIWSTGTNVGNAAITVIPHSNGTAAASGAAQNKVNELHR